MRVLNGIRFQKTLYQYENLTRWCNKDKFMSIEIKHVLRLKKKKNTILIQVVSPSAS